MRIVIEVSFAPDANIAETDGEVRLAFNKLKQQIAGTVKYLCESAYPTWLFHFEAKVEKE